MQESNNFCTSYFKKFSMDWMEFDMHLRLLGLVNFLPHSISSNQYSREKTAKVIVLLEKMLTSACFHVVTDQFLSNLL